MEVDHKKPNAIVADVAPYRISAEALLSINAFIDEFLFFVIDSARSLDLVKIKQSISQVIPTTLGKNAVQEAELELKTYVESGNSDSTLEKTIEITPFPLQKVFEQFRAKCQFFSTLGERGIDERDSKMAPNLYANEGIHIAPSLAIYLTAILEYVGEHILILVAKATEKSGTGVAKLKEVYNALVDDNQIRVVFRRTNLKLELEEKLQIKTPASPASPKYANSESIKSPRFANYLYEEETLLRSPASINNGRPLSDGVTQSSKNPSSPRSPDSDSFEFNMRSTKSMQSLQCFEKDDTRRFSKPARNFENLLEKNNNQTVKISLTPNRIKTIEKKTKKQESLYEFLKNTDPDDIFGDSKIRKKDSKVDLIQRRGKDTNKTITLPEYSPNKSNKPRYIPLIPPGTDISSIISTTSQPEFSSYNNKSLDQSNNIYSNNNTASKSTSNLQNGKKSVPVKLKPRPEPLYLDDDDDIFYTDGQKRAKRRTHTQDLVDFLNSSPPNDLSSPIKSPPTENSKKSEKKFKKFFSKLMKQPSTEDVDNQSLINYNRPATPSTPKSYISTTSTLVSTKSLPKYVKIEIQLPAKETQEQSIYDQVQIQGRHARQTSRNSLTGSIRTQSPIKPMFSPNASMTGTLSSPTIDENAELENYYDDDSEYFNKPIKSNNNDNIKKVTKEILINDNYKKPPTQFDQQKNGFESISSTTKITTTTISNSNQQQKKSQIQSVQPIKFDDQSKRSTEYLTKVATKTTITTVNKQPTKITITKQPTKTTINKVTTTVINPTPTSDNPINTKDYKSSVDNFMHELIYAEFEQNSSEIKESDQIIIMEKEIDESEEALITEWLLGTGLAYKQIRPIVVDVVQISESLLIQNTEFDLGLKSDDPKVSTHLGSRNNSLQVDAC
ncbi:39850_t:CDS:2 [Gigaspora margarita]|uniref:39850_t:CDS:1 n=1 Tax=Gigaspora margarita TaxID=4874 RepID=A0ABM8W4Y2_GIGMA|nr:39850_t:CDS:2 [Gigaspora margarita]